MSVSSVLTYESPVQYYGEDTSTGGNWVGKYGSCGHILPGAPAIGTETVVGQWTSPPIGSLGDRPYNWTVEQLKGLNFARTDPPYWDEYVPGLSGILYEVAGTRVVYPDGTVIQYPVFEWKWGEWHETQKEKREVYYTMNLEGTDDESWIDTDGHVNGPGWRLACWDDGGERSNPLYGYMNFTLIFPKSGIYMLSLYAYDFEGYSRYSQEYRIYDATGTRLLASKQIAGEVFDNGVYETFRVVVPEGGLKIILQVYNDAGHETFVSAETYSKDRTNNVVLSGIFVDCCHEYRGATIGFWKNNIGKQVTANGKPLVPGKGIQIPIEDIKKALDALQQMYPELTWLPKDPDILLKAYEILSRSGKGVDSATNAKAQTLSLLLTAAVLGTGTPPTEVSIPRYGTNTVDGWIQLIVEEFKKPSPNYGWINTVADYLNNYNHY
ncbi:MAG: hypothetical protein QXI32_01800 [Candidatus Bathyarchaeia archaeon]